MGRDRYDPAASAADEIQDGAASGGRFDLADWQEVIQRHHQPLWDLVREVAEHFDGTDAPLGQRARELLGPSP